MTHKSIRLALVSSIMIHAVFVAGIAAWSLRSAVGLGGGEGIVEVGVIGAEEGGSSNVSLRALRLSSGQAPRSDTAGVILRSERDEGSRERPVSPSASAGEGEGGTGGSGGGEGSGTKFGEGDPRLVAIWKKINRAKYYPEVARREGVEGAPKVSFSITEEGKVSGVKVVQSSGNEILDNAAVEAIQNSAPLPFYPQPITIAVRYSLK